MTARERLPAGPVIVVHLEADDRPGYAVCCDARLPAQWNDGSRSAPTPRTLCVACSLDHRYREREQAAVAAERARIRTAVEGLEGYRDPRYSGQYESPGLVYRPQVLALLAKPDSTGARETTEPPKDRWGRTAEMVELQNLMDEGDDD